MAILWPIQAISSDSLPVYHDYILPFLAPERGWLVRIEPSGGGYSERFDRQGARQSIDLEVDEDILNAPYRDMLALLGPNATVGSAMFSSSVSASRIELSVAYGVTARISFIVEAELASVVNTINLQVTKGNVAFNRAYDGLQPASATNLPLVYSDSGNYPTVTEEGVVDLLSDPQWGYEYQGLVAVDNVEMQGLAHVSLSILWQAYVSHKDTLLLGLGMREARDDADDPDNLFDVPLNDNTIDLLLNADYFLSVSRNIDLHWGFQVSHSHSDEVWRRAPVEGASLVPIANAERYVRRVGMRQRHELTLGYGYRHWRPSFGLVYMKKEHDIYEGKNGRTLGHDTEASALDWRIALAWSGVRARHHGSELMPVVVTLAIFNRLQGKNVPDEQGLSLTLSRYF